MTPKQAADAMRAFNRALPVAVLRGLRRGLRNAERLAKTRYMERKDNRHGTTIWRQESKLGETAIRTGRLRGGKAEARIVDPPNPPPGPLGIRQGNLARSVRVTQMGFDGRAVTGGLAAGSSDVRYAAIHEFGGESRPGIYIPPRPYLTPALRDPDAEIEESIRTEIMRAARAVFGGAMRNAG